MERKNLIKKLVMLVAITTISCNEITKVSQKENDYLKIKVEDEYLRKALDKFIQLSKPDSTISLLRVYVEEDGLNKSFMFLNTYTYDAKHDRKFVGYANYNGYFIVFHSSIDHILPGSHTLPSELGKFEKAEVRVVDYQPYKYQFDIISGTDTLYPFQTNVFFSKNENSTLTIERAKN
jgi:hypothetical protein